MYDVSGVRRYRETDTNSMGPEKLIVLLYEAIVKHETAARQALQDNDMAELNRRLDLAQRIITELRGARDHSIGPDIAANLAPPYAYMFRENLDALLDRDVRHLDNVLKAVQPLLEAWRQIPPGTADQARRDLARQQESTVAAGGAENASLPTERDASTGESADPDNPPPPATPQGDGAHDTHSLSLSA